MDDQSVKTFTGTVREIEIFITVTSEKGGTLRVPIELDQLRNVKIGFPMKVLIEDFKQLELGELSD